MDDLLHESDLLCIQRFIVDELRECLHCSFVVKFCHLAHQQTKRGIFELPGIIFFAAQLAGEDVFQLNVIALRERDVLGQLVDGQCIVAVLHDVAVDPLPVLPEVITGVQRLALGLFQYRVGKGGERFRFLVPIAVQRGFCCARILLIVQKILL